MMRRILLTLLLLMSMNCAWSQVSFGSAQQLNDGWLFLRVDSAWNVFENPAMKEPMPAGAV